MSYHTTEVTIKGFTFDVSYEYCKGYPETRETPEELGEVELNSVYTQDNLLEVMDSITREDIQEVVTDKHNEVIQSDLAEYGEYLNDQARDRELDDRWENMTKE